ncbi:hypothetical protein KC340_g7301 [Hortaea werneckii]|nr:hypothetical protein KC342_g7443 [Hortaea werneckii]KAI7097545.1 hypothetical protein KC339_g9607 [Hortaea werneckii]KAI7225199.1 hypothetical protein KC365_g10127 [Hortaea werneckii]KAI7321756.1 hypothetical protein KC340_g7301 [Hortaea werneckii]KAI7401436.1 hypothetical protein KC328_g3180 [Hortaea werneckii]
MAHAARNAELVENLITSSGLPKADPKFRSTKEKTLRGLKDHNHARTNQFAVQDRYNGLAEKFTVRNREDLSDALQARLRELPTQSKWLPEILALLLELSDRPLEKTKIEDLDALCEPADLPPELSWKDIVAEDPLDEDGIWDDVERGYHSSGDDATIDEDDEPTASTAATSVDEEDPEALARLHLANPDEAVLNEVQDSLPYKNGTGTKPFSELVLVRETLMMLRGLKTEVYRLNEKTGDVAVNFDVVLSPSAQGTLQRVCMQVAHIGSRLNILRKWAQSIRETPFVQSIQSAVESHLSAFSLQLNGLEQRYVTPTKDTVVSIVDVRTQTEQLTGALRYLADVIEHAQSIRTNERNSYFELLDALYNASCSTQMSGDKDNFEVIIEVFLAGVKTYLRPIGVWVTTGTLPQASESEFFVFDSNANCDPGKVWHERWGLRTSVDGGPLMPRFMRSFSAIIFAQGKAKAFLKLLGSCTEDFATESTHTGLSGFLETLRTQIESNDLQPVDQLFEDSFTRWLEESGSDGADTLRAKLFSTGVLHRTFDSQEYAFFGKDGTLFQQFAENVFERMWRRPGSWQDSFMLTEYAQSTLGTRDEIEDRSLSIHVTGSEDRSKQVARSTVQQLGDLQLRMAMPWPVLNITRSSNLPTHSAIFALLLQTLYAETLLRTHVSTLPPLSNRRSTLPQIHRIAFLLNWKLTCFVNALHNHITSCAANLHGAMMTEMHVADGVDSMSAIWAEYEQRLQTALLLAPNLTPIREAIVGILEMCEQFAGYWRQLFPGLAASTDFRSSDKSARLAEGDGKGRNDVKGDATDLLNRFDRSLSFVKAGLRGLSRAGGDAGLEAFAETLEAYTE